MRKSFSQLHMIVEIKFWRDSCTRLLRCYRRVIVDNIVSSILVLQGRHMDFIPEKDKGGEASSSTE